ncbi:MAG TPA: hypothetical protein VI653_29715 [Steroidobacteraceae bacterium]
MDTIFDYDVTLYDRRFLNCCQRHAIVWLKRIGAPVNLLFYNALASSDTIMRQMVIEKKPKYAIECDFYSPADLQLIGVTPHETTADRFNQIKDLIQSRIARDGFVLLAGNVFYFPHCPEYRNSHALHVVVLRGHDACGRWDVVDDNHASVLCEYSYEEEFVRDYFENNTDRRLRYFDFDSAAPPQRATDAIAARFHDYIRGYVDSYWFYDNVEQIAANPLDTQAMKIRALHDAFTILSGSRLSFAKYLEVGGWPASICATARAISQAAFILKSMMVKAQISQKLKIADLRTRCANLKELESNMLSDLRAAVA